LDYCIEIATTDFTTTEAAVKGGADRIELCSALSEGGLTPSLGLIKQCKEKFHLPIFPIIRPRGGDFLYTDDEFKIITRDLLLCRQLNCEGVVIGFLQKDGGIDIKRTELAVKLAYPMEVTFHRAFDRCRDPFRAMEQIISAGCQRILTSGQQLKAEDGAELIGQLITAADDRIVIMPGSGISANNIKSLAEKTNAVEFHGALRSTKKSEMDFQNPVFAGTGDYENACIDAAEVTAVRQALQELAADRD
jgi:copper homeostasis protein